MNTAILLGNNISEYIKKEVKNKNIVCAEYNKDSKISIYITSKGKKLVVDENYNLIDIVYEIIDARIPYSSKIKDIDDLLKDKPKILVVTKTDLCDSLETDKFLRDYEQQGYVVIPVDLLNNNFL